MSGIGKAAYVVNWQDLLRWDLKSARAAAFRAAHPSFQPLGNFVEEATEIIHPAREADHEWPVYGVNNKEGVCFSHFQKGETFNAPYKRIRRDWFFHNPTRANVGSLGRVPTVPPDAITSPEYQVWRIKRGLLPDFLEILIRLPSFLDLIEFHRVGAVKERLFVENLCEIPVPPLDEETQQKIVVRWREARGRIAATRAKATAADEKIANQVLSALGIPPHTAKILPKVFALQWKDSGRWSVSFLARDVTGRFDLSRSIYEIKKLGDIAHVTYGIQKCPANRPGKFARPYLRVANVQKGELNLERFLFNRSRSMV